MKIDIGLTDEERKAIAMGLSRLLADSYTLYIKTHNFHWNVTGPHFKGLHIMFEEQYMALALAVDTIAERIRAVGYPAPGSYTQFAKLTSIEEETTGMLAWEKMVQQLVDGHETLVRTARDLIPVVQKAEDEVTLGLLADRMDVHEKTAWMLRSILG